MADDTDDIFAAAIDDVSTPEAAPAADDMMGGFLEDIAPESAPKETDPPEKEPEPAQTEEDEDGIIPLSPNASQKSKDSWNSIKASRDKAKAEVAEREARIKEQEAKIKEWEAERETYRAKEAQWAEQEARTKDYEDLRKFRAAFDFENSPEYAKAVTEPLNALTKAADALAKSNESSAAEFRAALAEQDPVAQRMKLKELTTGWDEIDRVEALQMAKDAKVLLDKQDAMRAEALEAQKEYKRLESERTEQAKSASRQAFQTASKTVMEKLKSSIPFVALRDGETADDRFSLLASKISAVDVDNASPHSKAFMAAAAISLPYAVNTIAKLQSEIAALKTRIKDDTSASPKVQPTESKAPPAESKDFLEEFGVTANPFASQSLIVTAD